MLKRTLKLIIIGSLLLNSAWVHSQQMNIHPLQQREKGLFLLLDSLQIEKSRLLHQSDSLAALIQQLKSKQDLNMFQRRRLEQLLKSSQELDQKILAIGQQLDKTDREHQAVLQELVAWYDAQIARSMDVGQDKKLSQEQAERLANWQRERNDYLTRVKSEPLQRQITRPIQIDPSDSYVTIKQKADLVKDQEDKARKQIALVEKRVKELQAELRLRSRMNELIADTYLMDQPKEKLLPKNQRRNGYESGVLFDAEESGTPSSASFDAVDNLLLKGDVSSVSHLDLESQIRNLQQMKSRLTQSADSLGAVAEQFYQAAEKKRQDDNK